MDLIARYQNAGFEAVADGVMAFFDRRTDLQRPGVAFGSGGKGSVAKGRCSCTPVRTVFHVLKTTLHASIPTNLLIFKASWLTAPAKYGYMHRTLCRLMLCHLTIRIVIRKYIRFK